MQKGDEICKVCGGMGETVRDNELGYTVVEPCYACLNREAKPMSKQERERQERATQAVRLAAESIDQFLKKPTRP